MKRVLLIDDDKAVNFFNKRVVVGHSGFEHIKTVQSGKDGLLFLEQVLSGDEIKPDIIFLDINMPVLDGWQFLQEFLGQETAKKIIIYIVTSSANQVDVEKAKNYNMKENYIVKPISVKKLTSLFDLDETNMI